jgi:hypothetical protein
MIAQFLAGLVYAADARALRPMVRGTRKLTASQQFAMFPQQQLSTGHSIDYQLTDIL